MPGMSQVRAGSKAYGDFQLVDQPSMIGSPATSRLPQKPINHTLAGRNAVPDLFPPTAHDDNSDANARAPCCDWKSLALVFHLIGQHCHDQIFRNAIAVELLVDGLYFCEDIAVASSEIARTCQAEQATQ